MSRRLLAFVVPVFFLLSTRSASYGADETAVLHGRVLDSSGALVADASVALHQTAGSIVIRTATDAAGNFLFLSVVPGRYVLDGASAGLVTEHTYDLTFAPAESKTLDIVLIVAGTQAQVSVTAAGSPQSVDEISKALDVVSIPAAQKRGLFLISDAVRFVPGLRVSARGGPASFTEIQTRGLPVQDTAILLNGTPLRDPTSPQDEASAFLSQLLLVDSSRIEILRGSGSSLYGTNAVAGTLNILSSRTGGATHGSIDLQGGGLGLFEGSAQASGGIGESKFTYSAGVAHLNETRGVDGVNAAREWSGQGSIGYEINPRMHAAVDLLGTAGFAQTSITPSALSDGTGIIEAIPVAGSQLKFASQGLAYDASDATFLPSTGDPDAGVYSHFFDALFRFDQEVTRTVAYRIAYGLLTTGRNTTDGPGGAATGSYFPPTFNNSSKYNGHVDTLDASLHYLAGQRQIVTVGYEFVREHYLNLNTDQNPDSGSRIDQQTQAEQRFQSVYAQDEVRLLANRLVVLLSGRFTAVNLDQPAFVGGVSPYAAVNLPSVPHEFTGDASLAYFFAPTGTKVRSHVGNSFRMPSLYERFGGFFSGSSFFGLGDPHLGPERAISVDGGIDQYLWKEKVRLTATYYYSHLQQVIGFELFPPDAVDPYGRADGYYNTGGGLARGVELSGEVRPARHSFINASYTYTNTLNRTSQFASGTVYEPLESPRILPHAFKLVATQEFGRHVDLALDLEAGSSFLFPLFGYNFSASDAYRFDGPKQLGLSAGYTFPLSEARSLRFYTRVSNALNQDYYEDGFRTPGRWAVGGLHFRF